MAKKNKQIESILEQLPASYRDAASKNISYIVDALREENILTPEVLAYALATVEHESGFVPKEEIMADPNKSARNAYIARLQNNYQGGKAYRGRGFIQLTHKGNYEKFGKRIGEDLVNNPDKLLDPKVSAKVLAAYFKDNGVVDAVNKGDYNTARVRIQGRGALNKEFAPTTRNIANRARNLNKTIAQVGIPDQEIAATPQPTPSPFPTQAPIPSASPKMAFGAIPPVAPVRSVQTPRGPISAVGSQPNQSTMPPSQRASLRPTTPPAGPVPMAAQPNMTPNRPDIPPRPAMAMGAPRPGFFPQMTDNAGKSIVDTFRQATNRIATKFQPELLSPLPQNPTGLVASAATPMRPNPLEAIRSAVTPLINTVESNLPKFRGIGKEAADINQPIAANVPRITPRPAISQQQIAGFKKHLEGPQVNEYTPEPKGVGSVVQPVAAIPSATNSGTLAQKPAVQRNSEVIRGVVPMTAPSNGVRPNQATQKNQVAQIKPPPTPAPVVVPQTMSGKIPSPNSLASKMSTILQNVSQRIQPKAVAKAPTPSRQITAVSKAPAKAPVKTTAKNTKKK